MTADLHQHPASAAGAARHAGGGGNGNDLHGRVSALESELKHLATKSDVESIKTWALKGALGGMVLAATLAIAVLKLFGD